MINLEKLEYDHETKEGEAYFDGFLEEGFKMNFDYDFDEIITPAEDDVGISESVDIENFSFWFVRFKDAKDQPFNPSQSIIRECKHEIENLIVKNLKDE